MSVILRDFFVVLPEALLAIGGLVVLLLGTLREDRRLLGGVSLLWLATSAWLSLGVAATISPRDLFFGMLTIDGFTAFARLFALGAIAVVVLLLMGSSQVSDRQAGEWMSITLFAAIGVMLVGATRHAAMLYIAVELVSVASYLLVGMLRDDRQSGEGSLKYFIYGAGATAVMLYGISLLYGATGSWRFEDFVGPGGPGAVAASSSMAAFGLALVLVGIGFKVAMVPFHMWAPDAYQGAPVPVTAFLSVASKAAGVFALIRLVQAGLVAGVWQDMLLWISVLTMTVGNVVALRQTSVKRLMAYSSIAQAGYVLIGLVARNPEGMVAVLVYLAAYLVMNLGAFACIAGISDRVDSDRIDDYAGVGRRAPWLAAALTLFLLSLAGIPPMAGFIGKWLLFGAAIKAGFVGLAIVGVLNSVVSIGYYMSIVRQMYFRTVPGVESPGAGFAATRPLFAASAVTFAGMMLIGLIPGPVLQWIQRTILS